MAVRDHVLRDLALRAARDRGFLRRARVDLEGALARYGYDLTDEELRSVRALQRQTAGMSDGQVALALLGGLATRGNSSPTRPARPWPWGTGPARPGRPGN